MKTKIALAFFFCFISLSAIMAQNLSLDEAFKLDVESTNFFKALEDENPYITAHHSALIPDIGSGFDPEGRLYSALFEADTYELDYLATFLAEEEVKMLSFKEDDDTDRLYILLEGKGDLTLINGVQDTFLFEFPDTNLTMLISSTTQEDSFRNSYIQTTDNTIQDIYMTEDLVLLTGSFKDSLNYVDPEGEVTQVKFEDSEYGGYVIALDKDSKFLWAHTSPTIGLNFVREVATKDDKIMVAHDGVFESKVLELDMNGILVNETIMLAVSPYHLMYDEDGALYMSGHYNKIGDMETNVSLNQFEDYHALRDPEDKDAFLIKYDAAGNVLWSQTISGDNIDTGVSFDIENDAVYMTGCIQADGIFDPEGVNETIKNASGLEDIFLAKYTSDGDLAWVETLGGNSSDIGFNVDVDEDEIILHGIFRNAMDVDLSSLEFILLDENEEVDASSFVIFYTEEEMVATENERIEDEILFQNPVSQRIELLTDGAVFTALKTIDGNLVQKCNSTSLDVSEVPSGMYVVTVVIDGRETNRAVVIQN